MQMYLRAFNDIPMSISSVAVVNRCQKKKSQTKRAQLEIQNPGQKAIHSNSSMAPSPLLALSVEIL